VRRKQEVEMTGEPEQRLRRRYRDLPPIDLGRGDTALLIIDMQYGDAHRDHGMIRARIARGDGAALEYYADRIERLVVPNIQRLLVACRAAGIEVIHTKIQSLTRDGRDRSLQAKALGIHHPPGSKEAQILEELAPIDDEIVFTKTCGSVFNGTNIDYVLRNIGIRNLITVGVVASGCVELAVRDASDRSYEVVLVEDGTATYTPARHDAAMLVIDGIYARVKTTDEVLRMISGVAEVEEPAEPTLARG
jgi:nicotinamidase-related amidase